MAEALQQLEGKYEILRKLDEGGMGAIYKVRHRLLDEERVIKLLRPQHADDEHLRQRFRQEAKTAISLRHPNIAHLYDFSIDEQGVAFIVMEFIDGVTIDDILRRRALPSLEMGVEIALQGLRALSFLHGEGFIHRDISSDNLMIGRDRDGGPLVKLIDLGIAKNLEAEGGLTRTGTFLGKVRYSSPEQFSEKRGAAALDRRGDIYSYGIVLYELLTGHFPIQGDNLSELVAGHLFQPPKDFAETDPDGRVPVELRTILLKTLEKERDDRYQTCDELREALRGVRPAAEPLREELDALLDPTVVFTPQPEEETADPGSTQDRLNRQFAFDEASAERTEEMSSAPTTGLPRAPSPDGTVTSLSDAWKELVGPGSKERSGTVEALSDEIVADEADEADDPDEVERAEKAETLGEPAPLEEPDAALPEAISLPPRPERQRTSGVAASIDKVITAGGVEEALKALDAVAEELHLESTRAGVPGAEPHVAPAPPPQILEAVESISAALEAGDLDQARQMLEFARRRFGDFPQLDELAQRVP